MTNFQWFCASYLAMTAVFVAIWALPLWALFWVWRDR